MSIELIKNQGTYFGHPKALFLLFTTEMWERFSYYAMRAILVLYMVDAVQSQGGSGLGWGFSDALSLYGTFTMLVYLTPLFGGWIADNFLGQRKTIIIGGLLMAFGQFCLAMPHGWIPGMEETMFYTGLFFLIAGNGLFKPNISTMVGDLYEEGDHRRDGAFSIFYVGINVGAFLSGILVGEVMNWFGTTVMIDGKEEIIRNFQAGFAAAGIGMLLSVLIQFIFAKKMLGTIGVAPSAKLIKAANPSGSHDPLTKTEFDRIKVILILGVFTVIFWAGFEQAGGLMNIYADKFTDRMLGSWEVPTTYFQSLNPFFIMIFAPILAGVWLKLGAKDPNSPVKFSIGLALLGFGFLFMIGAAMAASEGGKASMFWLVGAYFFHTIGELCLSPIGLSMVTKLAPLRLASLLMGVWFAFVGVANFVAGIVGSLIGIDGNEKTFTAACQDSGLSGDALTACVEPLVKAQETLMIENAYSIFGGIAITTVVSAGILFLMADKLVYWMHGAEGPVADEKSKEAALKEELETPSTH